MGMMDCFGTEDEFSKRVGIIREKMQGVDPVFLKSIQDSFAIEYTHNSTAIEGNTLSLIQTKTVIEDEIAIGGKQLREIYEVRNHAAAYKYLLSIVNKQPLDQAVVKELHHIITKDIMTGGIYREHAVRITGAGFKPPTGDEMYIALNNFYADLVWRPSKMNSLELAAWTHAEFVRIHPFPDGNGRTAQLLLNYQLISNHLLPIIVKVEDRNEYYEALDCYACQGSLEEFTKFIREKELLQIKDYEEFFDIQ